MTRNAWIGLLVAAALAAPACRRETRLQGVGLEVAFGEPKLSDNLITDVTYTWTTGGDFVPFDRDLNVFVHFWHGQNLLVQDDYAPDVPTTKWAKNQTYKTTRRIYIPAFIDEFDPQFKGQETLRLSVGFYNPYDRSGKSQREVLARKLEVVPPPLGTPEVIYESGWYDLETDPGTILKQWRWTAREARCLIDNPRRDALLVIKGGANLDAVKDQTITLKINDAVLDRFAAPEGLFEKSYTVKAESLGPKDEFVLTIAVDKPFVPAKVFPNVTDTRELGIQVSFIYFR